MAEEYLQPRYFIVRENDAMIPLIAIDELPDLLIIQGVERTLKPSAVAGMTCVGVALSRQRKHKIIWLGQALSAPSNSDSSYNAAPVVGRGDDPVISELPARSVPATPVAEIGSEQEVFQVAETKPAPMCMTDVQILRRPLPRAGIVTCMPPNVTPPTSAESSPPGPSTAPSTTNSTNSTDTLTELKAIVPAGVKQYCSYWLRKGECDYAQQGCLYKHEMPTDQDTLTRLGLRDIPQWYRDQHGIGSFLAVPGAGASFSGPSLKSEAAAKRSLPASRFASTPSGLRVPMALPKGNLDGRPTTRNGRQRKRREPRAPGPQNANVRDRRREIQDQSDTSQGQKHKLARVPPRPRRRQSLSAMSMITDMEGELIREDAERKAQEAAEYAVVVAAQAKRTAEAAQAKRMAEAAAAAHAKKTAELVAAAATATAAAAAAAGIAGTASAGTTTEPDIVSKINNLVLEHHASNATAKVLAKNEGAPPTPLSTG